MDKASLSERDICTKFITPALRAAGWDEQLQIREEVSFTKGRIIVRGKLVTRGKAKRADYVLYYKPNIPIALIEAKDNKQSVGAGIQQALEYAETLDIPFVFSSNGDGFVFHDRTGASAQKEARLGLDDFPSPADLWRRYSAAKGLTAQAQEVVLQDYYDDGGGNGTDRKQAIIDELADEGLPLEVVADDVGKDLDPFDLICHIAFDQPPLTRHERAEGVRKRDVFTRYGPQARAVLEALLTKYEDDGVLNLDDPHVLQISPFDQMGTPVELVRQFGGRGGFEAAVHDMQSSLYGQTA